MHLIRILFAGVSSLALLGPLYAEDLRQVYELATYRDPTIQAAYASLQANRQQLPLAIAQMIPNLSANYSASGTSAHPATPSPFVFTGNYNTKNYGLTLSQPIYHPELWGQLEQSRHLVKSAMATYVSATQELIIRVTQQYFSILTAIDDLDFFKGQRTAFEREYEQAKQRFDVGLIAITDVETAKAKFDTARANEISANNAVADQYEKLREIVGEPIQQVSLFPMSHPLNLLPPSPNLQEEWVMMANLQNSDIIAAREQAEQQKAVIGTQVAGHFPKVDLSGNLQRSKASPPFNDYTYYRSVSLNVSIPLFSGGGVVFKTREASARYSEALELLERQQRTTQSATRQAFRGVLTTISRVQALNQAVISNDASLRATKAAYEVGTRTIVDVLNAESDLLSAKRDLSKARYNYLYQGLLLKQAAGSLTPEDLYLVNQLMLGKENVIKISPEAVKKGKKIKKSKKTEKTEKTEK